MERQYCLTRARAWLQRATYDADVRELAELLARERERARLDERESSRVESTRRGVVHTVARFLLGL
jgi:hypothetical protein